MLLLKIYKLSTRSWLLILILLKQLQKPSRKFSSNLILTSLSSLTGIFITLSQLISIQPPSWSQLISRPTLRLLQMPQPPYLRFIKYQTRWRLFPSQTLIQCWPFTSQSPNMKLFTMMEPIPISTSISIHSVIHLSHTNLRWNQCRESSSPSHLMLAESMKFRLFNFWASCKTTLMILKACCFDSNFYIMCSF